MLRTAIFKRCHNIVTGKSEEFIMAKRSYTIDFNLKVLNEVEKKEKSKKKKRRRIRTRTRRVRRRTRTRTRIRRDVLNNIFSTRILTQAVLL